METAGEVAGAAQNLSLDRVSKISRGTFVTIVSLWQVVDCSQPNPDSTLLCSLAFHIR
jgi:hypothetical protein